VVSLDDPGMWPALDPQSMRGLIESFPAQFRAAARSARQLKVGMPSRIDSIVVCGLGGSAIGGDVVRSAVGHSIKVPFTVSRDYTLPPFVTNSTLVFACSYSGNTEETLACYSEAQRRGAAVVCIASGGRLAEFARHDGYALVPLPPGLPPRAALGYSSILLLGALEALGLVPDQSAELEETSRLLEDLVLRYGARNPAQSNLAKKIAHSLQGRMVAIYGSSGLLDAAAARWRGQIEENAKNLAFHHVIPEMNHNELVGWLKPEPELSRLGVVFLRDRGEHQQVRRRFEATVETITPRAGVVHEVWSEGESLLARIFSVICLGDFVSLYLSYLNKVDPTPVDAIESLKQKLTASSPA
jgi:glucose/mannose-6-phosphate isomerase